MSGDYRQQAKKSMDDEERQQLRELLRVHQSQLQMLDLQAAKLGVYAPAYMLTEIEDTRAKVNRIERELVARVPVVERSKVRELKQRSLTAYYAQQWERAEDLLIQLRAANADDQDAQTQLIEVQRQLDLRAWYQALCDLRDVDNWRAVLVGLDDLNRRQPDYQDSRGLRAWTEKRKYEDGYSDTDNKQKAPFTNEPQPPPRSPSSPIEQGLSVDIQEEITAQQALLQSTRQQLFETVNLSPKPFAMLLVREVIRAQQEKIRRIKVSLRSLGVATEDLSSDEKPSETDLFVLTMLLGVSAGIPMLFLIAAIFSGLSRTVMPLLGIYTAVTIAPMPSAQGFASPTFTVISTPNLTIASVSDVRLLMTFDEGVGANAADTSGNANNGRLVGTFGSHWPQGKAGSGLYFDGASLVRVEDSPSLRVTSQITVEAWIRPALIDNKTRNIVSKISATEGFAYRLFLRNGSPIFDVYSEGFEGRVEGPEQLHANQWYRLTGAYDGANLRLFVDGSEVRVTPYSKPIRLAHAWLAIGGSTYSEEFFLGDIDEVKISGH